MTDNGKFTPSCIMELLAMVLPVQCLACMELDRTKAWAENITNS